MRPKCADFVERGRPKSLVRSLNQIDNFTDNLPGLAHASGYQARGGRKRAGHLQWPDHTYWTSKPMLPILLADTTQLAIGWGITAGGIIISIALICFPWKRKSPLPEEHK
jgi:hypothetical protein